MRNYELMVILDPALGEEETEKLISKIEAVLEKQKAKIEKINKWGKRALAYPIKQFAEGFYIIIKFSAQAKSIKEIKRVLAITGGVVRDMIICLEKE